MQRMAHLMEERTHFTEHEQRWTVLAEIDTEDAAARVGPVLLDTAMLGEAEGKGIADMVHAGEDRTAPGCED